MGEGGVESTPLPFLFVKTIEKVIRLHVKTVEKIIRVCTV